MHATCSEVTRRQKTHYCHTIVKGVLLWTCFGSIQNDLLSFIINEKNYLNENKKGKHVKGEIGCRVLKLQQHVNVMMVQGCDKKKVFYFLKIFLFLFLLNIFCCFKWLYLKEKCFQWAHSLKVIYSNTSGTCGNLDIMATGAINEIAVIFCIFDPTICALLRIYPYENLHGSAYEPSCL